MAAAAGLVVYALDPARVGAFYEQAAGLVVTGSTEERVVLEAGAFQVVVVRVPAEVAADIEVTEPPQRREDTALKPAFSVGDLAAARAAAARAGGVLDPPEREWRWQGWTVCDGHDPEGNVVQLRTERPPGDPH